MPIYLWCVHYIKIFLFMSLFHLCPLSSVLWKFLQFFLHLKFDNSPLNTWKQRDLDFACFQGGKTSKFKSRKNGLKSTFSPIFFNRTYYHGKRHDMKQCTTLKNHFLKNTCNLRHSNAQFVRYVLNDQSLRLNAICVGVR